MTPDRPKLEPMPLFDPNAGDGRPSNPPEAPAGLPTGTFKKARVVRAD